jgi:hypothetical protein
MELDRDAFLVTVYCVIDDLYRAEFGPRLARRPGARGKLSDSEVLTLAVLAQWEPRRCEHCFLRAARARLGAYFPALPSQSAFNRRVRNLWAVLGLLGPLVAREVARLRGRAPAYEAWDGVPVPLMRRCRGGRRKLFGLAADFGRGGSDEERYYGVHLLAALGEHGALTGGVLGPAATSEYWLAEALLRWRADPAAPPPTPDELAAALGPTRRAGGKRAGPTGPLGPRWLAGAPAGGPIVSDLGLAGRPWREHWRARYGTTVLTKADYAAVAAPAERERLTRWLNGLRQDAEAAFSLLTDRLGLKFPRARSLWGLWTRLAAKLAAFNLAVYANHRFGRPTFALFDPLT